MPAQKYRKRPVVIDAILWEGNLPEVVEFIGDSLERVVYSQPNLPHHIEIKTLEGVITASMGDYVIKGIKEELYPCKPDIFQATYEEIDV